MGLLATALVAAIQVTPQIIQYINLQQMAADISDSDLAAIRAHEHQDVADFGAQLAAVKLAA